MNSHFSKVPPKYTHKHNDPKTITLLTCDKTTRRVIESKKPAPLLIAKKGESEQSKQETEVSLCKLLYSMHL